MVIQNNAMGTHQHVTLLLNGNSTSSFIADNWTKNPEFATRIKQHLHVDDLVMKYIFDSTHQAIQEIKEAIKIFDDAQFELRKIKSNCTQLLDALGETEIRTSLQEKKNFAITTTK
jgi:mevalonate kinase